jgi:hypothetical protein
MNPDGGTLFSTALFVVSRARAGEPLSIKRQLFACAY